LPNAEALQRHAAGMAVSSLPGTGPETNVPAQVPPWRRLGSIRYRTPRTPPQRTALPKVDFVAKPNASLIITRTSIHLPPRYSLAANSA
jgi:hypothetical protein